MSELSATGRFASHACTNAQLLPPGPPPTRALAHARCNTTFAHHRGRSLPGSAVYDPPTSYSEAFWRVDGTFGCGDMMYSGHMVSLTIDACIFGWYPNPLGIGGKVSFVLAVFAEALLIIGARKHYTADTIVGGESRYV